MSEDTVLSVPAAKALFVASDLQVFFHRDPEKDAPGLTQAESLRAGIHAAMADGVRSWVVGIGWVTKESALLRKIKLALNLPGWLSPTWRLWRSSVKLDMRETAYGKLEEETDMTTNRVLAADLRAAGPGVTIVYGSYVDHCARHSAFGALDELLQAKKSGVVVLVRDAGSFSTPFFAAHPHFDRGWHRMNDESDLAIVVVDRKDISFENGRVNVRMPPRPAPSALTV
ncbi:MAG: hypothetical protein AB7G06_05585 [Bdellovibrionales bacterium]